jgi:hypothetical protein
MATIGCRNRKPHKPQTRGSLCCFEIRPMSNDAGGTYLATLTRLSLGTNRSPARGRHIYATALNEPSHQEVLNTTMLPNSGLPLHIAPNNGMV